MRVSEIGDIEVALPSIRREGDPGRSSAGAHVSVDESLPDIFAGAGENLDPLIIAVRHIDQSVLR